jgi:hypothetical protein
MNDPEILAAVLRWSAAFENRKKIGSKKRLYEKELKVYGDSQFDVYLPTYQQSSWLRSAANDAALRLTIARRRELAAMRDLAKVCAKVREGQSHVADADVIDVPVRLTYAFSKGE